MSPHAYQIEMRVAAAAAVVDRWTVGFGVMGIANRLNWSSLEQTTYTLESLIAGADFRETTSVAAGDTRVELPVDYRGIVAYAADRWSAATEMGPSFGGALFHGGCERRRQLALAASSRITDIR